MRIKSASFKHSLDLVRVCLQLPSQKLANQCMAKFAGSACLLECLKTVQSNGKNVMKK